MTDLSLLGWTAERTADLPPDCAPARVTRVDRGRLTVVGADGERRVHPAATLFEGVGPGSPAVGDWVALRGELAVAVLPRRSAFTRTVTGRSSAAQVVAANLDVVLVVEALVAEAAAPRGALPGRRVEQRSHPLVVLTKAGLCDDVAAGVEQVAERARSAWRCSRCRR